MVMTLNRHTHRAYARVREGNFALDGLLGIADPDGPSPQIDPDAWRRRIAALISTLLLTEDEPALFVVEDVHWIDVGSESLLAELLTAIRRTRATMLITARPEFATQPWLEAGAHLLQLPQALEAIHGETKANFLRKLGKLEPFLENLEEMIQEKAVEKKWPIEWVDAKKMVNALKERAENLRSLFSSSARADAGAEPHV